MGLYVQVLIGIVLGVAVGVISPAHAVQLRWMGDGFIRLIQMMVGPIVLLTVMGGIARLGDLKRVGRVGLEALVYFEVLTTAALLIGLGVGEVFRPGSNLHARTHAALQPPLPKEHGNFLFDELLPKTVVSAFSEGKILQILLLAILFGVALALMKKEGQRLVELVDLGTHWVFRAFEIIMRLAPLGAFGAMAFTVGQYGAHTLVDLGKLVLAFYVTGLLFVILVLGAVLRWAGLNVFRFVRHLRDELFLVLGTSSSESALTRLMTKLADMGCSQEIVDLVIPAGYSFNLDGTSIYLTLATLFIAQAMHVHITLGEELGLLAVLLLTSKGAAAVTGGGFVVLSATLSATGKIPLEGLALIFGVDRFMSEARALINLVGNGVAAVAVSKFEGAFDREKARRILAQKPSALAEPKRPAPGMAGR